MSLLLFSPLKENTIGNYLYIPKNWYGKRQARKDVDRPGHEKTARICNLRVLSGFELKKWWSWWLCSGTSIAPQNPTFLSIPRSSLTRYDTSSAAFRLLIYGEKVGKKTFHGEEMGNF